MFKQTKKRLLSPLKLSRQESTVFQSPPVCGAAPVLFSKYKGCLHNELVTDIDYCRWILSTEDGFATKTKVFITDHFVKHGISLEKKKREYRQKNIY